MCTLHFTLVNVHFYVFLFRQMETIYITLVFVYFISIGGCHCNHRDNTPSKASKSSENGEGPTRSPGSLLSSNSSKVNRQYGFQSLQTLGSKRGTPKQSLALPERIQKNWSTVSIGL